MPSRRPSRPIHHRTRRFRHRPTLATRLDPTVDFVGGASPGTNTCPNTVVATTNFLARWKGQVQPQYSETYYFDTTADDGVEALGQRPTS